MLEHQEPKISPEPAINPPIPSTTLASYSTSSTAEPVQGGAAFRGSNYPEGGINNSAAPKSANGSGGSPHAGILVSNNTWRLPALLDRHCAVLYSGSVQLALAVSADCMEGRTISADRAHSCPSVHGQGHIGEASIATG
mmetsp:Transcript_84401/g.167566  ORF Transcript_84401/g.167566 Transcript_84401/m.167566 type:complete len:139 (-) Transcript_84401:1738-2154(-)